MRLYNPHMEAREVMHEGMIPMEFKGGLESILAAVRVHGCSVQLINARSVLHVFRGTIVIVRGRLNDSCHQRRVRGDSATSA